MGAHNDPIADMLTQIRNGSAAEHRFIDISWSRLKEAIIKILKEKGLVAHYLVKEEKKKPTMRIFLKYASGRKPVLMGLKRVSTPSRRYYVSHTEIPRTMGGMGIAVLSTSQGVVDGAYARQNKLGGELMCIAW